MGNSYPTNIARLRAMQFEVLESRALLAADGFAAFDSIRTAGLRLTSDTQETLPLSLSVSAEAPAQATTSKPRLLVLTDIGGGDPDDEQSLVRLLAYANEFRIEGLIAGSTLNSTVGVGTSKIRNVVNHYESVQQNLSRHASGYPTASYLRTKIAAGQPNSSLFGQGHDTPGSNRIIDAVDASSERLNIAIWGGSADLAQALWRVRHDRSQTQVDAFVAKLRVAWIEQGPTDGWIKTNFPDMWVVSNIASGDPLQQAPFRGMYLGGDTSLASRTWVQDNVKSHRPYGTPYPETAAGAAMKEGDTPTWFYFLPSNLSNPDHPEWGGWGGRYEKHGSVYSPGRDNIGSGYFGRDTVSRWRLEFQNDFAARMDWTQANYSNANHNPVAQVNVPNQISVLSGQQVTIDASSSWDPDGDSLSYEWFQYREAGSYSRTVPLDNALTAYLRFLAPEVSSPQTIHIILRLRDNGGPNLFDYQRVIVTVQPSTTNTIPPQTPVAEISGAVIDLQFNEGTSTSSQDFSGLGNHAELVKVEDDNWVAGEGGHAVRLDGDEEYAYVPAASTWGGDQANFSISTWVKFDDFSDTNYRPLASVGNWSDQRLYLYPINGRLQFTAASDGWKTGALSSPLSFLQEPDNQFHHIVAVKDNNSHSASIYVDGALVGRDNYASGSVDLAGWNFNLCGNAERQISCELDNFAFHHEALTASRVSQLFEARPSLDKSSSMADIPVAVIDLAFREGTGATSSDQSGFGNTGFLLNTENSDWVSSAAGGVRLDNLDERVQVRSSPTWATEQESFSVSMWVQIDELDGSNYDSLVSVGKWSDQRLNIYIIDGRLQFTAKSKGWGTGVVSDQLSFLRTTDRRVHHVVAVKDEATHSASIYVDGKLVGHDPYASGSVDLRDYDFSLCADSTGARQIACTVHGVALYHGVLDPIEISKLHIAGSENTSTTSQDNKRPIIDLRFEEGTGTETQDRSGHGNTGRIANTEDTDWVNSSSVNAIRLDGKDELVRVHASDTWSKPQSDFTLSVWLKFDDPTHSNYASIASVGSWEDQRLNLYRADGRLYFVANSSELSTGVSTPHFSFLWRPDNRYHHIVVVKDSTTHSTSLYVDGQLAGRDDYSKGSVDLGDWDFTFGGNSAANKMMPITLAEAKFFDRALSTDETSQLHREFW